MNKSAVAMAADSAVTISGGRGGVKTYDTVNKLFELLRGSNIGVMVYSNAEINDRPWESIVKVYRQERGGTRFPYLEDYVEDFTKFLASSVELIPVESDLKVAVEASYFQTLRIFSVLKERQTEWITSGGRIVKSRVRTLVDETVTELEEYYEKEARDADWKGDLDDAQLQRDFGPAIRQLVDDQFDQLALPTRLRRRISDLCMLGLSKCLSEPSESGLVLAGFGDKDYLPKTFSARVRGRLGGVLRVAHGSVNAVTADRPGYLQTFAQDEQAWGFLSGINSEVRDSISRYWGEWVLQMGKDLPETIKREMPRLSANSVEKLSSSIQALNDGAYEDFLRHMNERQDSIYLGPMIQSVAVLPKDELGILAESLVNLTSLKQKMSIFHAQTVGGPIDLALISPGDGFVWIQRKHYFTPELNPHWHLTHHAKL